MRMRHILGVAIFCGAVGTLGGQSVQAQRPNSPKFIKLLLSQEATAIKADTKALNMRDRDIAKLETANPRQSRQLEKSLNKLLNQILHMTTKLQATSTQIYTGASILTPPTQQTLTLKSKALTNLLAVQTLSIRAGLGILPATPSS